KNAPNVFITRTFSKIHGLAAERIGWGYGASDIIDALHRIRAPFNVTTAGQQAAIAALGDDRFIAHSVAHNMYWRSWLKREIEDMADKGFRVIPSWANFLTVLFEGKLTAEQV